MSKSRLICIRGLDFMNPFTVRAAAYQMSVTVNVVHSIARRTAEGKFAASIYGMQWCYADEVPDKWPEPTPAEAVALPTVPWEMT